MVKLIILSGGHFESKVRFIFFQSLLSVFSLIFYGFITLDILFIRLKARRCSLTQVITSTLSPLGLYNLEDMDEDDNILLGYG